ncbi:hypothetical protein DFR79_11079 [Halanaerobium saccharolyticum]|uniref:Permease n=1 Tax=Halanaerobium saccharolyticum TaxID=43595 RepID=A0A4V3CEU1_9FIRM|nr:putative manganese transporter [Halanaerobium saccharolyticum]TDO90120.1 hypothetical protein DFR79_11079 [Halanaerobium saccharolyticum]
MVAILIDSIKDVRKVIPLVFLIFLAVDYLMLKFNQNNKLFVKLANYDVLGGGLLGILPQCAIPVAFARLFSNGYITLGMMLAIFISSSDEALVIIGSHPDKIGFIAKLVLIKILLGVSIGYLVNLFTSGKKINNYIKDDSNLTCSGCINHKNIIVKNIIYTLKISIFLVAAVFLFNLTLKSIGKDAISVILGKNTFLQPIYAVLIGMLPSCMSSVILAEGFIKGVVGFGALLAGLSANTGYGILIILKELPFKKAVKVISLLLGFSLLIGETIYIFGG